MNKENFEHQFGKNDFEVSSKEVFYDGFFRLVRYHLRHKLFDGGWSEIFTREILERSSAAALLPYDPVLDHVILIEQFRPGSMNDSQSPWLIEIPAGIIGAQNTPQEIAIHEAFEEAGCQIESLHPICEYYVSPGGSNEYISIYCGKIDAKNAGGIHGLSSEHENIRAINVPRKEALQWVFTGKIKTAPAMVSLLWLELNKEKIV